MSPVTLQTAYANTQTWMGCAVEAQRGVPVANPAFWIPVINPKLKPTIVELQDIESRGDMNTVWHQAQGVRHEVYTFKCLAHLDVLPHILRSVLGSPDTVAPSGGLFSHALSLLNNSPTGQPPSYTWFDYDGYRMRQMAGGQTDSVTITWKANGLLEVQVKLLAYPFAASVPGVNAVISTYPPTTGWDATLTLNSIAKTTLTRGSLTFRRKVVAIDTLGSQTPYALWADRLDVRGEIDVINTDDDELNAWLADSQWGFNLLFQNLNSVASTFTLDGATTKFEDGGQSRGQDGVITTTLKVLPLPNTTDATAGGSSPVKATIINSQSTAY